MWTEVHTLWMNLWTTLWGTRPGGVPSTPLTSEDGRPQGVDEKKSGECDR
jgi:hypothetical protein